LRLTHRQYKRSSSKYKSYTLLSWLQPWVAWAGLVGCIVVFAFSSATWWNKPASFTKVAVAYAAVRGLPCVAAANFGVAHHSLCNIHNLEDSQKEEVGVLEP
jgi:amino acid permease